MIGSAAEKQAGPCGGEQTWAEALVPGTGECRALLPVVPGHGAAPRQLSPRVPRGHRRAGPPPSGHQGGQLYPRSGQVLGHPDTGAVSRELVPQARGPRGRPQSIVDLLRRQPEDRVVSGGVLRADCPKRVSKKGARNTYT